MAIRRADNFIDRINNYVPLMAYDAGALGLENAGAFRVDFGAPVAASATNIINAQSIASTGIIATMASTAPIVVGAKASSTAGAPYGRALQYVASGANTAVIETKGFDYLRQPVTERVTLNGATPVNGLKAFWSVVSVNVISGNGAVNLNVGTRDALGLPYAAVLLQSSIINGLTATAFTFVARDATSPATALTGDTRGTVLPGTATNGSNTYAALFELDKALSAGLHGVRHFS